MDLNFNLWNIHGGLTGYEPALLQAPLEPPADTNENQAGLTILSPPLLHATGGVGGGVAKPSHPPWGPEEMGALRLSFARYGRDTAKMLADPLLKPLFRPERTAKAIYQRISGAISVNVPGKRDAIMVMMHYGSVSLASWESLVVPDVTSGQWPSAESVFCQAIDQAFMKLGPMDATGHTTGDANMGARGEGGGAVVPPRKKRVRTAAFAKATMPAEVFLQVLQMVAESMVGNVDSNVEFLVQLVKDSRLLEQQPAAQPLTVEALMAQLGVQGLAGLGIV